MTVEARTPDDCVVTVTEELVREFGGSLPPRRVHEVVHAAGRELRGQITTAAMGEMLHRLARYRLQEQAEVGRGVGAIDPDRSRG
jgi:hypothetical protein